MPKHIIFLTPNMNNFRTIQMVKRLFYIERKPILRGTICMDGKNLDFVYQRSAVLSENWIMCEWILASIAAKQKEIDILKLPRQVNDPISVSAWSNGG